MVKFNSHFLKDTHTLKDSVVQNKKRRDFEKKQRLDVLRLRNKFLGEWASNVLGLKETFKKNYISKIKYLDIKKHNYEIVIREVEEDFIKNNIKISFNEIEFKIRDFQLKANVIIENKFKLDSWRQARK